MWTADMSPHREAAPYLPWEFSQPNGLEYQQCVSITLDNRKIGDFDCHTNQVCSLCEFHGSINFHIHGLPETSPVDHDYIFVPELQTGDRLTFMGHKQYLIRWVYKNNIWELLDRSHLERAIGTFDSSGSKYPIGKGSWNVNDKTSIKPTDQRDSIKLKLSKV